MAVSLSFLCQGNHTAGEMGARDRNLCHTRSHRWAHAHVYIQVWPPDLRWPASPPPTPASSVHCSSPTRTVPEAVGQAAGREGGGARGRGTASIPELNLCISKGIQGGEHSSGPSIRPGYLGQPRTRRGESSILSTAGACKSQVHGVFLLRPGDVEATDPVGSGFCLRWSVPALLRPGQSNRLLGAERGPAGPG